MPDDTNFVIADLSRLMRAQFERLVEGQGLGLTAGEAGVLVHLNRCGPIRQHLLAARLGLSGMTVTNYVDRLQKAGLVMRGEDPTDRRAKIVSLTPQAALPLAEVSSLGKATWRIARGGIDDDDWKQFIRIALKMRSNLIAARRSEAAGKETASE
ncbi:MAG: winged helix-turn-helix transcriptional regulator [Nitratireductor sp.]|nr:winged helix-turn-helix transcriptional regulator [Nitratireductor sp.]